MIRLKGAAVMAPSRARRVILGPGFKEISPFYQSAQLSIGNAALQHPQAAVWMNISQPPLAEGFHDLFDAARYEIGVFHFIVLYVDDTDPQGDFGVEPDEIGQFPVATAREFKQDVSRSQRVQEGDQLPPEALLNCLSRVIAKADVNRLLHPDAIQNVVDCLTSPFAVFQMAS